MKTEIRQFARTSALKFPILAFFIALLLVNILNAQSVTHIASGTIANWSGTRDLNYSVVVDNGAVLRIASNTHVRFYYADMQNDNEGDLRIEVAKGGRLIIDGTPSNHVVFEPKDPSPSHPIHWQGIILDGNDSSASVYPDTLKFFEVNYAKKGLVINRPVELHAPYFDHVQTGIEADPLTPSAKLILPAVTITNVTGTGLIINQPNTSIPFLNLTTLTNGGNGIEINENNITIDWAAISAVSGNGIVIKKKGAGVKISNSSVTGSGKSGIFNDQSTANLTLTNCSISSSGKSGLFNVDGTAAISNSTFNSNAFSGIVNSSGTVTITNSNISSNTVDGITACGLSTTTGTSLNLTNNTKYGVNISDTKVLTDVSPITGTPESAPTIAVTYSNITGNNGTSEDVNNASTSTTITDDFTYDYWGVASNVGAQVKYVKPNSVNYMYWVTSGAPYTIPGADLSTGLSINVDQKTTSGGLNYVGASDPFTLNWKTTGNYRFVEVAKTEAGMPAFSGYFANTGTYTFIPGNKANVSITVSQEDGISTAQSVTITKQTGTTLTFPVDGGSDVLIGGKDTTITWVASSSITSVTVDYKIGAGIVYTPIATAIPNTGSCTFHVPNLDIKTGPGGLFIRITEVAGGVASDENGTGAAISPSVDASWNFTPTTSSENFNITTITEDQTVPDTQNRLFAANEVIYIGAFYKSGTKCAGYVKTTVSGVAHPTATINTNGASLVVYGDDPLTPDQDGFKSGETIKIKVWRADKTAGGDNAWGTDLGNPNGNGTGGNVRELTVTNGPTYNENNLVAAQTLTYSVTAAGAVTQTTGPGTLQLDLTSGPSAKWFLYSSYVNPTVKTLGWIAADVKPVNGPGLNTILSPLSKLADDASLIPDETQGFTVKADAAKFQIMKDVSGKAYWVDSGAPLVTDFTSWDITKGYFINMASGATGALQLDGSIIDPTANPLSLTSGWNLIPYYRYTNMAPDVALSSIAKGLVIVKDINGSIYWPAYGINTLTNLMPGRAYLVRLNSAQTLTYPANTGTIPSTPLLNKSSEQVNANTHFKMDYNSDNNAVVAVLENALKGRANIGDEIAVVNSEGKLCGSAVYNGGNTAVMIFGIESGKTEGNGMKPDESYSFRLYNKNTGKESILSGIGYTEGLGKYSANGMSVIGGIDKIESAIPQDFALSQNYPNPFNPSTTIKFAVPQYSKVSIIVYNTLGQMVRVLADGFFEAGYHSVQFNAQDLSSGVYIYQIRAGSFTAAKKLNLLK